MIAIPNIEKPKCCRDCRLHSYDWGDEYIPSHDVCHALSIYFNKGYEEKHIKIDEEVHPDCPLIEIVTCGECKHRPIKDDPDGADYGFNIVEPTDGDDLCPCLVEDGWYSWMPEDNFYCGRGERRTETLDERIKRGLKEWREK